MTKIKKRYAAIASEPRSQPSKLAKAVTSAYKDLFGALGLASARLKMVKGFPEDGIAVFKCRLEHLPRLFLAAASVTELDGERAALRVMIVSGTIRKVKENIGSMKNRFDFTSREA